MNSGGDFSQFELVDINDSGAIAATAVSASRNDRVPVLLVPVDLVPDYNRDGKIDLADTGKVTVENPWRWWINDDDDEGEIASDGSDNPRGENDPDADANHFGSSSTTVDGLCDLPDFFPLHLDIREVLKLFPPAATTQYKLTHANSALSVLETEMSCSQARDFITDGTASAQLKDAQVHGLSAGGYVLKSAFLNELVEDAQKGILLLEGARLTDKPLKLEIWKNGSLQAMIDFPLQLSEVKHMYRWINLRGVPDIDPDGSGAPLGEVFRETNTNPPSNRPDSGTTQCHFIMVHGYNVEEAASEAWGSETFKRLYQMGMNAKFTMVSWRGDYSQTYIPLNGYKTPDYWENITNAFITSPHLKEAVVALPGQVKIIAGHSMGNMLVTSAINDHNLQVDKYFLLDAAVPLEAFDATAHLLPSPPGGTVLQRDLMRNPEWQSYNTGALRGFWASEWHKRFDAGDNRRSLTWISRFANITTPYTIEKVRNYYSSGEEVLQNADGTWPDLAAERAWVYQEMGKGRPDTKMAIFPQVSSDLQGGWEFNPFHKVSVLGGQSRPLNSDELLGLDITTTAAHPFFFPLQITDLHASTLGPSTLVNWYWVRAKTLAEAIPALSNPAGSNPVETWGERNIDLMTLKNDDNPPAWPLVRPETNSPGGAGRRWWHSDAKDVALRFNYSLYRDWIQQGGMN